MGDGVGQGDGGLVLRRQRPGAVQHQQGQRCLLRGGAAALHTHGLHGVAAVADARRVDEPQEHAAHGDLFLHRVAGGAGDVGDDSPVIAQEGVQQRGFAGVRLAQQHRGHAQLQQTAAGKPGHQRFQIVLGPAQGVQHLLALEILDVLVRIVHHGVEPGGHVHEAVVDTRHGAAQRAVQLADGVVGLLGRLGVDQVRHGLRLEQVQLPIEKGPLGKLAGTGLTAAGGKQGAEARVQHDGAAVAVELGAVLSGIAVGRREMDAQHAVDDLPRLVQQLAQHHGARVLLRGGPAVFGAEHRVQRGTGIRAGQAQDTDGAGLSGRGDGGDGVGHRRDLLAGCFSQYTTGGGKKKYPPADRGI